MNIFIISCSRRKITSIDALPALDVYQGGCVPYLRNQIENNPEFRSQVFILSAKYGLLGADDRILAYDQPLTLERAEQLRSDVGKSIVSRVIEPFRPEEIAIVLEPLYLVLVADLLANPARPQILWEPNLVKADTFISTILERWGWLKEQL
jgi:hypothetical protein